MNSIVVVGGGITGAFTAYFLARAGVPVVLIERDEIGVHASGTNPGGLNPLHGPGIPGPMQELALESFRLHVENWSRILDLSGIDFRPQRAPRLHLAIDDHDVAELERAKEPYDVAPGFSARWLEPKELLAGQPDLNSAVTKGLWTEGNAKVDPAAYTRAVAKAAVHLGAEMVTAQVRGLQCSNGRANGVVLDSGSLDCVGVVIATGPWCAEPARWLDTSIPVEPVKGEMVLVERDVQTDLAWREVAVYGASGGRAWLGGTEDRAGFDRAPTTGARRSILDRASQVLPSLRGARVLRHVAALRPVTPDGLPIVGLPSGWENACLAVGAGRKGMLLGAGLGHAAADLVVRGSTQMPIDTCSPERWAVPGPE